MVKLPTTTNPPPEGVERRTQVFHDYGALMSVWAEFELAIELKIAMLTGMKYRDASIVLGGLTFGNKPSILFSLLSEIGEQETIEKVRAVINQGRRNTLVHSVRGVSPGFAKHFFIRREVKNSYKISVAEFTSESFHEHLEEFRRLYFDALNAMGITYDTVMQYVREAGLFSEGS